MDYLLHVSLNIYFYKNLPQCFGYSYLLCLFIKLSNLFIYNQVDTPSVP